MTSNWEELGGAALEPPLRSGAIALLDAKWLVEVLASKRKNVISRRQELPPEAFLTVEQIREALIDRGDRLPIILLSYM